MTFARIPERVLGKSGIPVTSLGLGLWAAGGDMWGPTNDKEVLDTIGKAVDEGITFFDTADVYGDGHSEELLGRAIQGRRERLVVATKIGWTGFDGARNRSAYDTVEKLVAGVEGSLRRLRTDYVDVIQDHIGFREANMEVFVSGFERLQRAGKARAYGVSTSDLAYLKAFNAGGGCAVVQVDYSILNRTSEGDVFPYCAANNIGVIVRGPLAMGILTGKFSADAQFPDGDFRQRWLTDPAERKTFLEDLAKVERLKAVAAGRTLAQLALQFVLADPAVSVVIPGAKNTSQLADNLGAVGMPALTSREKATIDAITPPRGGRKIWPA